MVYPLLVYSINFARILAYCSMLVSPFQKDERSAETALVRVNIIAETRVTEANGSKGVFEVNGKRVENYSPTIIQDFTSTGIVFDHKGNVLTFLGYRWVDIQRNPRIEITTSEGQKLKGKLIGIDQTNSVAVIQTNGKLKKTPICSECEIMDGSTIISPLVPALNPAQYLQARVLAIDSATPDQGSWIVAVNHPFPEVGQPILTTDHRVLGFIAGQDPADHQTIVYPIDLMMASAEKILKAGGDVRAGWLGVLLLDAQPEIGAGVVIQAIEPGSPAQKAGLSSQDLLQKYNGKEIQNVRQFIQLVEGTPIGSKADIEITRQGNPLSLAAMIEARMPQQNQNRLMLDLSRVLGLPAAALPVESDASQAPLKVGLEVTGLTPSLADALKIPGQRGLLITDVVTQSPAERAGIRIGDVILSMNGQRFLDPISLISYFEANGVGPQLNLKIFRKGAEQAITIQVP
jgi:S1-C subfamily serine protease